MQNKTHDKAGPIRLGRGIGWLVILLGLVAPLPAQTVEERLAAMESRIRQLENELAAAKAAVAMDTAVPATSASQPARAPVVRPAVLTQTEAPALTLASAAAPLAAPTAAAAAAAPQGDDFTGDFEGLNFFRGVKFGGFLEAYYNWDFNEPASGKVSLNNFNFNHNSLTLSQVDFELTKPTSESAPLGYMLQMMFGPTADWVNGGDFGAGNSTAAHFLQYYLSGRVPVGRGLTVDVGKFVTQHGAEVIDSRADWNYSRGLLFSWAIPYYHFGVRATLPVTDTLTIGASLSNGWNNVVDNNGGKTGGFALSFSKGPVSFVQNYMVGPEQAGNSDDVRHLFDSLLTVKLGEKVTFLANYDYGMDRAGGSHVHWQGVATYLRLQPTPTFALTPRFEYFDDRMGFATGTAQILKEFTLTPEIVISNNLVTRFEYRRDWSNRATFEVGDPGDDPTKQDTLGVGMILKF